MTPTEFYQNEMRKVHEAGVRERLSMPYTDHGIPFRVLLFRRWNLPPVPFVLEQGVDDTERAKLRILSGLLAIMEIEAAIVQTDTRMADMDEFAEFHHFRKGLTPEEVSKEYSRILGESYGGYLENAPRPLWRAAIVHAAGDIEVRGARGKSEGFGQHDGWMVAPGHEGEHCIVAAQEVKE